MVADLKSDTVSNLGKCNGMLHLAAQCFVLSSAQLTQFVLGPSLWQRPQRDGCGEGFGWRSMSVVAGDGFKLLESGTLTRRGRFQ